MAKTAPGFGCGAAPIFSAGKSYYVQRASSPIANWMVDTMVDKNKEAPWKALAGADDVIGDLYVLAGAVAVVNAVGAWGGYAWRDNTAERDVARVVAQRAADREDWERQSRESEAAERARETALRTRSDQEVSHARLEVAQQRHVVAGMRAELDRVRRTAAALAPRAGASSPAPAATAGGDATAGPGLVPPDVLGRCAARTAGLAERLVDLAELAEARKIAGQLCVALSAPTP